MKFSRNEKFLLFVLAVVAVLFGGFRVLDLPAFSGYRSEASLLRSYRIQREQAEQAVKDAPDAERTVNAAVQKAVRDAGALLPSMDAESLEVWLVSMAQSSGMKVSAVSLGALQSADIGAKTGTASAGNIGSTGNTAAPSSGTAAVRYRLGDFLKAYRGQGAPASVSSAAGGKSAAGTGGTGSAAAGIGTVLERDVTLTYAGREAALFTFMDMLKASGRTAMVTAFSTGNATVTVACFGSEKPGGSDTLFPWSRYAK